MLMLMLTFRLMLVLMLKLMLCEQNGQRQKGVSGFTEQSDTNTVSVNK